MKYRYLFVFALCSLFVAADTTQAQDRGKQRGGDQNGGFQRRGQGGPPGQDGPGGQQGGRRGGPGGRGSMMSFLPVLAALDADKDGKISSSEIENAAAALKTLDKNGDGSLTEDEVRPSFGGRGGPGGRPGMQGRGGERGGPPGQGRGRGPEQEQGGGTTKPKRPSFDN